jgi:hypothetical protein
MNDMVRCNLGLSICQSDWSCPAANRRFAFPCQACEGTLRSLGRPRKKASPLHYASRRHLSRNNSRICHPNSIVMGQPLPYGQHSSLLDELRTCTLRYFRGTSFLGTLINILVAKGRDVCAPRVLDLANCTRLSSAALLCAYVPSDTGIALGRCPRLSHLALIYQGR